MKVSEHYQLNGKAPLFLPLRGGSTSVGINADGTYKLVGKHLQAAGTEVAGLSVHSLHATASTIALDHEADITKLKMRQFIAAVAHFHVIKAS